MASRSVPSQPRPDRIAGRPLSPRAFRSYGIEALLLGPPVTQTSLTRRAGVALWRRLPEHAALFDRVAAGDGAAADGGAAAGGEGEAGARGAAVIGVRVVVVTARSRDRSLRVPAVGQRAERVAALAAETTSTSAALRPASGCVLLVDEGPGETWLYLAASADPEAALEEFTGRRGRTDFARARRRARRGGLGGAGIFTALVLVASADALGLGALGQLLGALLLAGALALLVTARPR